MSTPEHEYRIASLIEDGLTNRQILRRMNTSEQEINYIKNLTNLPEELDQQGIPPTEALILYHVMSLIDNKIVPIEGQIALELGINDVSQLAEKLENLQQRGLLSLNDPTEGDQDESIYSDTQILMDNTEEDEEDEEERQIRPEEYPARKPRLALWLQDRLTRKQQENRAAGTSNKLLTPEELTEYIMVKAITRTTTKRILMQLEEMQALLINQDRPGPPGLSPDRYPMESVIYIEAHQPGLTAQETNLNAQERMPDNARLEGILVAGKNDTRLCTVCYSSPEDFLPQVFRINLPTGTGYLLGKSGNITPSKVNQLFNFIEHLTNPLVEIVPEPLNRQQRRRLERTGLENPWHMLKPMP